MRIVETAWLAHPHPDLADAYAHVRLGDAARQRLVRVETLAAKTPGHIEGALAIARAAIDAAEFARAREVLAPFTGTPTQRVAMLMAEIERTEHGDSGRARGVDLARGARAARSGLDRRWLCQRSLAAGISGNRPARRVQMADAACRVAFRQTCHRGSFAVRASHARALAPRRAAARASGRGGNPAGGAGQCTASRRRGRTCSRGRRARAAPERIPAGNGCTVVPRAPGYPQRQPAEHPGGDSHCPGRPTIPGSMTNSSAMNSRNKTGPPPRQAGGWRGFLSRWGG